MSRQIPAERAELLATARKRLFSVEHDDNRPENERPQGFVLITRNPDTAGPNAGNVSFVDGTDGHLLEALEAARVLYHEAHGTDPKPIDVEKLLTAIRTVNKHHNLGDAVYDVRSSAAEKMPDGNESSWNHPDVTEYSQAVLTLTRMGVFK